MSSQYTSLTMNVVVDANSVTVAYERDFMFVIMLFVPALVAVILYSAYIGKYALPSFFMGVLIFFFVAFMLSLVAHLNALLQDKGIFLWRVDRTGFYFQATSTNLFSLKDHTRCLWSEISKVVYVQRLTTLDHDLDKVIYKDVILLYGCKHKYTMLTYPGKIGLELFEVIKALAPSTHNFESLDSWTDI